MATLFKSTAGAVFVENIEGPQNMAVSGIGIFDGAAYLLADVTLSRKESVQHMKALTDNVYSYAYGEMPGQAQVSGIVIFSNACGGASGNFGIVNSYYSGARAYRGGVAYLGIGGAGAKVLMTGLQLSAVAGPFPHGKFTFIFDVLP